MFLFVVQRFCATNNMYACMATLTYKSTYELENLTIASNFGKHSTQAVSVS